jgi:hypothetical protein
MKSAEDVSDQCQRRSLLVPKSSDNNSNYCLRFTTRDALMFALRNKRYLQIEMDQATSMGKVPNKLYGATKKIEIGY